MQQIFLEIPCRPGSGLDAKETKISFIVPDAHSLIEEDDVRGTKLQDHRALCHSHGHHVLCWEQIEGRQ